MTISVEALASLWIETQAPDLVHLLTVAFEPIDVPSEYRGRGKKAHERWMTLAASLAPGSDKKIQLLLASLTSGNSVQALERLQTLHGYYGDYRMRIALEKWCVTMPYRTPPHANRFWKQALEVLSNLVDANWDAESLANQVMVAHGTSYSAKLAGWIRKLEPQMAPPRRTLTEKEKALVDAQVAKHPPKNQSISKRSTAALLEEIAKSPRDDAPRVVLADLLQEQDDPRGEFIALQCVRAEREGNLLADNPQLYNPWALKSGYKMGDDEIELILKWHGEWLGPWLSTIGLVLFERGFPVLFSLNRLARKLGKLVGDPGLATIEHVIIDDPPPSLDKFLNHPVLGNLRTLQGITMDTVTNLNLERAAQIESLTLIVPRTPHDSSTKGLGLLPLAETLPNLQHLCLRGKYGVPTINSDALTTLRVPELEILRDDDSESFFPLIEHLHPSIKRFVNRHRQGPKAIYHLEAGSIVRCELHSNPWVRFDRLLSVLPPSGVIESTDPPIMTTAHGSAWGKLGQLARVSPHWEEVKMEKQLDWSTPPTDLPVIDLLVLSFQDDDLDTLKRLEGLPEVVSVHYSFSYSFRDSDRFESGEIILRRDSESKWHSLELQLGTWPPEATIDALLDPLGHMVSQVHWPKRGDEPQPEFSTWKTKHRLVDLGEQ